jgi:DNA-binding transcriptional regulator YiaG
MIIIGRTQAAIAQEMSVSVDALRAWERGRQPPDRFWPAVIAVLGFDPSPLPRTPGEQLEALRRATGLSQRRLARAIGCDERTLAKWARDRGVPGPAQAARLKAALGLARRAR